MALLPGVDPCGEAVPSGRTPASLSSPFTYSMRLYGAPLAGCGVESSPSTSNLKTSGSHPAKRPQLEGRHGPAWVRRWVRYRSTHTESPTPPRRYTFATPSHVARREAAPETTIRRRSPGLTPGNVRARDSKFGPIGTPERRGAPVSPPSRLPVYALTGLPARDAGEDAQRCVERAVAIGRARAERPGHMAAFREVFDAGVVAVLVDRRDLLVGAAVRQEGGALLFAERFVGAGARCAGRGRTAPEEGRQAEDAEAEQAEEAAAWCRWPWSILQSMPTNGVSRRSLLVPGTVPSVPFPCCVPCGASLPVLDELGETVNSDLLLSRTMFLKESALFQGTA